MYQLAGLLCGTGVCDLAQVFNTTWNQVTKVCFWTDTNPFGVLGLACEKANTYVKLAGNTAVCIYFFLNSSVVTPDFIVSVQPQGKYKDSFPNKSAQLIDKEVWCHRRSRCSGPRVFTAGMVGAVWRVLMKWMENRNIRLENKHEVAA